MRIENQVCSLELAKRLKELGVKQESSLFWTERWMPHQTQDWLLDLNRHGNQIAAFTVAELGEMIPEKINFREPYLVELPTRVGDGWVYELPIVAPPTLEVTTASTEADARAKMLVYLLETKLVTV